MTNEAKCAALIEEYYGDLLHAFGLGSARYKRLVAALPARRRARTICVDIEFAATIPVKRRKRSKTVKADDGFAKFIRPMIEKEDPRCG
jgi:hypothetical protein